MSSDEAYYSFREAIIKIGRQDLVDEYLPNLGSEPAGFKDFTGGTDSSEYSADVQEQTHHAKG